MKTSDIMTRDVVSVLPTATISDAACLMLINAISGLPVIDKTGVLVGVVTEGDFLRRSELGTEKYRLRWIDVIAGPETMATQYIQSHSRKVSEVMSRPAVVVREDTSLEEVVHLMETKHLKRLPVVRDGKVVGIICRANLMRALAALNPSARRNVDDEAIRTAIEKEIDQNLSFIGRCNVVVQDGVVDLWGTVYADRDAIRVAAENVPGVKAVHNHLIWVHPFSGTVIESTDHAVASAPAT